MKEQVYTELDRLKQTLVDPEIVAGIIESDLRSLETRRQRNGHWVNVLESYHERGEDPRNHLEVEARYQSLTGEQIMKVYQDYFNMDRRVETFMMPESYAP